MSILIAIEDVGCCCLAYVLLIHGARCAYHISTSNEYISMFASILKSTRPFDFLLQSLHLLKTTHSNMNFSLIPSGKNIPENFNVVIEIAAQSDPVKYEVDEHGHLWVDRFVATNMRYPSNYGFIPHTLAGDGDPVDVLVVTPFPLLPGSIVACRALGVLKMSDDGGEDAKVLAVPVDKVCRATATMQNLDDVCPILKQQLVHFFEQYKALEPGKWVKIDGWADQAAAHQEIRDGVARHEQHTAS